MNLNEIIKTIALNVIEENKPSTVKFGEVVSASPLQIKIDSKLTLDEPFLIKTSAVSDCQTEISFDDPTIKNIVKNYSMDDEPGNNYKLTFQQPVKNKTTVYNALRVGEKVILLRVQGGQKYIILDRVR